MAQTSDKHLEQTIEDFIDLKAHRGPKPNRSITFQLTHAFSPCTIADYKTEMQNLFIKNYFSKLLKVQFEKVCN